MTVSINIGAGEESGRNGKVIDAQFAFGNFCETCTLPLNFWNLSDYVLQWVSTLSHVIDSRVPGAIITTINDPSIAVNLVAWILYPLSDGSVKIQEHMLGPDEFVRDQNMISQLRVRPREVISEDGEKISEWTVSIADLMAALKDLRLLQEYLQKE